MTPFKPKTILVPTDFSELSTIALRHAGAVAERFSSRLVALYADRFGPADYLEVSPEYFEDLPALQERARAKLSEYLARELGQVLERQGEVMIDFPVPAILRLATDSDADLIVMGTHGRTGWRRALLGSIAEAVLHASDRPVMTVRHLEGEAVPGDFSFHRILCPVNFTEVARDALDHAMAIGAAFDAELIVLHVAESQADAVQPEELLERMKEWIRPGIREHCDFKELVMEGNAAEQVIEFARRMEVDLIALGAQHQRFSDTTVLGTTTERITRYSYCPVLTITRRLAAEKSAEAERSGRFMEPVGLMI